MAYHYLHAQLANRGDPPRPQRQWRSRIRVVEWTRVSDFSNATYHVDVNDPRVRGNPDRLTKRRSVMKVKRQLVLDFYHGCARYLYEQEQEQARRQGDNRTATTRTTTTAGPQPPPGRPSRTATSSSSSSSPRPTCRRKTYRPGRPGVLLRLFQRYSARHDDPDILRRFDETDPHVQYKDWDLWFSARPCVILPRVLIGAAPSNESDVRAGVPDFRDPCRFDTFRYRYQSTPRTSRNDIGKSFAACRSTTPSPPTRASGGAWRLLVLLLLLLLLLLLRASDDADTYL
jgi:hypothetical protein